MSVDLSLDVQRHLARVYAVLATCILASAGSAAALPALVPWEAPNTTIVTCVSIAGLIVGVIAFACTPTERMVVRFVLLMAMCMCGGTFFAFLAKLALDEDPSFIPKTLLMTATIFVGCSAAAIFTPQKKRVFYVLSLGLVVLSLAVVSIVLAIFSIFVFSSTLEAVYTLVTLVLFSLYVAWETEVIILRASEGDRDPVGDAAQLFSDLLNVFFTVASCLSSAKSGSAESAPLLEGSAA